MRRSQSPVGPARNSYHGWFAEGVLLRPGEQATTAARSGHQAPMPLLVVAKSLNAWVSLLFRMGKLKGIKADDQAVALEKDLCQTRPLLALPPLQPR